MQAQAAQLDAFRAPLHGNQHGAPTVPPGFAKDGWVPTMDRGVRTGLPKDVIPKGLHKSGHERVRLAPVGIGGTLQKFTRGGAVLAVPLRRAPFPWSTMRGAALWAVPSHNFWSFHESVFVLLGFCWAHLSFHLGYFAEFGSGQLGCNLKKLDAGRIVCFTDGAMR